MLTALENGLGSCTLRSFDEAGLKRLLAIPESHDVALAIALGYPAEAPVMEVAGESITYWVDGEGVRHVPKRRLADILHRNRF
jgi:nitroreductase